MALRQRQNSEFPRGGGKVTNLDTGNVYATVPFSAGSHRIDDDTNPGDGQPLYIRHRYKDEIARARTSGVGKWSVEGDWCPSYFPNVNTDGIIPIGVPTIDFVATRTMAATNPSKPRVDAPVAFYELKDMIPLIRNLGAQKIRRWTQGELGRRSARRPSDIFKGSNASSVTGEAYLLYTFGLAPLIDDIAKILTLSKFIDRRVKDLEKLRDQGGYSKKHGLGKRRFEMTGTTSDVVTVNSLGPSLRSTKTEIVHRFRWGVAKWAPLNEHSFPRERSAMRRMAHDALRGLHVDPSTIWETIPWSWMVDWVVDVGGYLAAHKNTVPARCTQLYVCTQTDTETHYTPSVNGNLIWPGGKTRSVIKEREPILFTTPAAQLPFLNAGQWSIISSLAVSRMR